MLYKPLILHRLRHLPNAVLVFHRSVVIDFPISLRPPYLYYELAPLNVFLFSYLY